MIPSTSLYLVASAVYAVAFVVLGLWYRRLGADATRLCVAATGIAGVSAVAYLLMGLEVGQISVAGGVVDAPNLFDDVITYATVYGLTAVLAGASKRLVLTVSGIVAVQRLAFELPYAGIVDGVGALVAAGVVIVGWFVITAIFVGPIWRAAQHQPAERRLVHWKCRNLVLFLFAMLIVYAMAALTATLTEFLNLSLNLYLDLLMRLGVALLLFMNAGRISTSDASTASLPEDYTATAPTN